jgi:peptide/nickel transport system ATP-binding protein
VTGAAEVLRIEALSLATRLTPIVEDVSFLIGAGEFLAVVGESGSGKTMVARAVLRLLPDGIAQTGGRILLNGEAMENVPNARLQRLRGGVAGMVFQEPMLSLNPAMTIGAQMAEGLWQHTQLGRTEMRARMIAMLERVQISDPARALKAWPHEFSGGMRQRIMLASVMLLKPRLLIADEPTTALDTLSQREVLDLMAQLARDEGTAVMLITHNLGLVARYAQRAVVMRRGRLVESGEARHMLRAPREDYTKNLIDALPRPEPKAALDRSGPPLVVVHGLSVRHRGRRTLFTRARGHLAVEHVNVEIWPGEILAVVGGSGSGKTTLGRAVLGLIPREAGMVSIAGVDMAHSGSAAFKSARLASQFVFQDPFSSLDPRMRIGATVAEPLRHVPQLSAKARLKMAEEVLERVGLGGYGERFPHALSGGQRQRVAIARAIVRKPRFVVADEPVSALDMTVQKQVLSLFRELQLDYGFACLFISHDLGVVEQVADRIIVMHEGRIVEEGSWADIESQPKHPYTKALLAATPSLDFASSEDKVEIPR